MELVNFSGEPQKFFSKKNVLSILIILNLLIVIPFAVKMIQNRQVFESQATVAAVNFSGDGVLCDQDLKSEIKCSTSSETVTAELNSPWGTGDLP